MNLGVKLQYYSQTTKDFQKIFTSAVSVLHFFNNWTLKFGGWGVVAKRRLLQLLQR